MTLHHRPESWLSALIVAIMLGLLTNGLLVWRNQAVDDNRLLQLEHIVSQLLRSCRDNNMNGYDDLGWGELGRKL